MTLVHIVWLLPRERPQESLTPFNSNKQPTDGIYVTKNTFLIVIILTSDLEFLLVHAFAGIYKMVQMAIF